MSQTLSAELEGTGVRVQVVCPGVVATEFHERQGLDLSAIPRMTAADVVTARCAAWSWARSCVRPASRTPRSSTRSSTPTSPPSARRAPSSPAGTEPTDAGGHRGERGHGRSSDRSTVRRWTSTTASTGSAQRRRPPSGTPGTASADDAMWSGRPNGRLVAEVADLTPGRALDVGCGEGADAIWLAQHGWTVIAIDVSDVAVGRARRGRRADRRRRRLGGAGTPFRRRCRPRSFDLVSLQYPALPKAAGERRGAGVARHGAPGRRAARRLPRPRPRPPRAHEGTGLRPGGLRRCRRPRPAARRRLHRRAPHGRAAHRPAARQPAHRRRRRSAPGGADVASAPACATRQGCRRRAGCRPSPARAWRRARRAHRTRCASPCRDCGGRRGATARGCVRSRRSVSLSLVSTCGEPAAQVRQRRVAAPFQLVEVPAVLPLEPVQVAGGGPVESVDVGTQAAADRVDVLVHVAAASSRRSGRRDRPRAGAGSPRTRRAGSRSRRASCRWWRATAPSGPRRRGCGATRRCRRRPRRGRARSRRGTRSRRRRVRRRRCRGRA